LREQVDGRTAHEIVGATVSSQVREALSFEAALQRSFQAATGRPLSVAATDLQREVEPERVVGSRRGVVSCAPAEVRRMAEQLRQEAGGLTRAIDHAETAAQFPATLRAAIFDRIGRAW
jgi:argininosuccinate lyase